MTVPQVRVVKVGGSLFLQPDLPLALQRWLAAEPPAVNVCIAGGGELADCIRTIDQVHQIGDQFGHWLCVRLLEASGDLLARLLPHARRIDRWDALLDTLRVDGADSPIVFTAEDFLISVEPQLAGHSLAHDWRTSSDSIAARVAWALKAFELVLLKSCPDPLVHDWEIAARDGLVDHEFAATSAGLTVRWVNLRTSPDGQSGSGGRSSR